MDWTIYCYHNIDALRGVLNAIAMVAGASDYKASVAFVLLFGFFAALTAYAFAPQKMQGWQWLASVVLVYLVLFVPKARVQLLDVTAEEPPAVVANVPFGLAVLAGATSQVGHTLTGLMETAFSSIPGSGPMTRPEELSYQRNGMMFGARMISTSQNFAFNDAEFRADMLEFLSNCVSPALVSGDANVEAIRRSTNIWKDLEGVVNPARFSMLFNAGAQDVQPCNVVYNVLNGRMGGQVNNLIMATAFRMHPNLPPAASKERIESEITASYATAWLTEASQTAGDIVAQNAMINSFQDGSALEFVRSGDTTGLLMNQSISQTYRQKNSAFIANAKIAEQALPVVRNVVEAVTYALFPIVLLLMLLTSGRETWTAFRNYASVLIWIQLWPPLYAVLNFMAGIYASYDIGAAGLIDAGSQSRGVALATFGAINDNALSCQAVVGYLTFSIPVIAWYAVKRMENLGTALAGSLNKLEATGDANASSASMGNASWGMLSRNQANVSPSQTNPYVRSWQGADATTFTRDQNGRITHATKLNSGGLEHKVALQIGATKLRGLEKNEQVALESAKSEGYRFQSALREHFGKSTSVGDRDARSESNGYGFGKDGSDSWAAADAAARNLLKTVNLGDNASNREAAGLMLFGNGLDYSGSHTVQTAIGNLKTAVANYDRTHRTSLLDSARAEARHSVESAKQKDSSTGKESSFTSLRDRAASASAKHQEAVAQREAFAATAAATETLTVDLMQLSGDEARAQLQMRNWTPEELSEWIRTAPLSQASRIELGNLLAPVSLPSVPSVSFQGETVDGNKSLGDLYNAKKVAQTPVDPTDVEEIRKQYKSNNAVVAAQKGPDARAAGHVQAARKDAGGQGPVRDGKAFVENAVLSRGADTKEVNKQVDDNRTKLKAEEERQKQRAAAFVPGANINPETHELSVQGKVTPVAEKLVVEPAKQAWGYMIDKGIPATISAAEHYVVKPIVAVANSTASLAESVRDETRASRIASAKGPVTPQSLERAREEVSHLKQAAKASDPAVAQKALTQLHELDQAVNVHAPVVGSDVPTAPPPSSSALPPESTWYPGQPSQMKSPAWQVDRIKQENPGASETALAGKSHEALRSQGITTLRAAFTGTVKTGQAPAPDNPLRDVPASATPLPVNKGDTEPTGATSSSPKPQSSTPAATPSQPPSADR